MRHLRQTSESIHSGAVWVSTIAVVASAGSFGGKAKPAQTHVGQCRSTSYASRGPRTFVLQLLVYRADVAECGLALEGNGPVLDIAQDGGLDVVVEGGHLEDGDKVVHELAGGDFSEEVVAAILNTDVCELKERQRRWQMA